MRRELVDGTCDGVFSDVSHNLLGHASVDVLKQLLLVDDALAFATQLLTVNGVFVAKFRQGGKEGELLQACRRLFAYVDVAKPPASRSESAEVYLVCKGFGLA